MRWGVNRGRGRYRHDQLHVGEIVERSQPLDEIEAGDHDPHPGMAEQVTQEGTTRLGVDGYGRPPTRLGAVERRHELDLVAHHQPDVGSRADGLT